MAVQERESWSADCQFSDFLLYSGKERYSKLKVQSKASKYCISWYDSIFLWATELKVILIITPQICTELYKTQRAFKGIILFGHPKKFWKKTGQIMFSFERRGTKIQRTWIVPNSLHFNHCVLLNPISILLHFAPDSKEVH